MTPYRPLGGATRTPGYFSPRKAKTHQRSIIISSKTRSGKNRLGYKSKTMGNGAPMTLTQIPTSQALVTLKKINRSRDAHGTLVIPQSTQLPRVAQSEFHQKQGFTSPRKMLYSASIFSDTIVSF